MKISFDTSSLIELLKRLFLPSRLDLAFKSSDSAYFRFSLEEKNMDALVAVLYVIGGFVLLGIVGYVGSMIDWDEATMWGCFTLLYILPTPLAIVGLIAGAFWVVVLAEVLAGINSLCNLIFSNDSVPIWVALTPLLPTVLLLTVNIVQNHPIESTILAVMAILQFGLAISSRG